MDTIKEIQNWYNSHCNGEWEHDYGIKIGTLDNPGWTIEINLAGTKKENIKLERVKIKRTEHDWLQYWVENNMFNAACGALNLEEALEVFLKWAK